MRLIDADGLIEALDKGLEENTGIMDAMRKQLLVGFAKQILNDSPTVNADAAGHGRWDSVPNESETVWCSECGWMKHTNDRRRYNYCPSCGCKMDK